MSLWDNCSNLSGDNVRGYGIKFKAFMVANSSIAKLLWQSKAPIPSQHHGNWTC